MCLQNSRVVDLGLGWKKSRSSRDPMCSIPFVSQLQNIMPFCELGLGVDLSLNIF